MPKDSVTSLIDTIAGNVQAAAERTAQMFSRNDLYTKGDILEVPTGWDIEIMDPQGDVIATLHYIMTPGQRWGKYVEDNLHSQADGLLSHLNRG